MIISKRVKALTAACMIIMLSSGAMAATGKKNGKKTGKDIYEEQCTVCHGELGNGQTQTRIALAPPPKDFTNPLVKESLTREQMIYSVTMGRPGTGMMPWKSRLSTKEIELVVDYIKGTLMK